ncbi:MAG: beta-propeller fold lactonase family protein [Acidobacteria bacterium]|nr:beta-propeller fold lactonase family protein [Acidobacteriota bacterium]
MWVATQGDQMIRSFTINQATGQIFPITTTGSPVPTGVQPSEMVTSPDGKTIFLVNSGGTVTAYTINQNGTLTAAGSGANAGQLPVALAVDPTGKFLFVANQGTLSDASSGTISVFSISGASLAEVAGSPFPTGITGQVAGTGPSAVAVSPAGNFLYVANQFSNTVQSFSFDSTGALSLIGTYTAGTAPSGLAFSRCAGVTATTATCPAADGNNLFVANAGSNNISIFSACIQISRTCSAPNGTLTQIPNGSPVSGGGAQGPAKIFVNPGLDFVYAVNRGSNQVSEFQYVPATGALTFLTTASSGASVFSGAITANVSNTTKTFNWVVLTNNGASSLSIFRVAALSGKLIAPTVGQYAVAGQPSAILLR